MGFNTKDVIVYLIFDNDKVQVHSRMRTFKLQKNTSIAED